MNNEKKKLLIVEDDPGLQKQLRWCFENYDVIIAEDKASALEEVRLQNPPVVLQDLGLPPDPAGVSEGLATLQETLAIAPNTKIIVVTGNDDHENAVKAVGLGAYDFYQKPVETGTLSLIVDRAYQMYTLEDENRRLLSQQSTSTLNGIVSTSEGMLQICRLIEKVAPTNATVLLLGESGTGKELLARAIHALSPRAENRFVAISCAAIPDTLLESELFGYERGAFTGAVKQTHGKIEHANGGTLFLDEIGDMPLALQAKLLRFLQERVIERIGGRQEISVDVRVVSATNQDLTTLMEQGRFREDLYYRVSEVSVNIPPVREREGDAMVLARIFLEKYARHHGRPIRDFSKDAIQAIQTYSWPGNVRELENKINGAVIVADGSRVSAKDLELGTYAEQRSLNLRKVRQQAEREAIKRALKSDGGNISKAAEVLGVSRPTLYDLINKYGLK